MLRIESFRKRPISPLVYKNLQRTFDAKTEYDSAPESLNSGINYLKIMR